MISVSGKEALKSRLSSSSGSFDARNPVRFVVSLAVKLEEGHGCGVGSEVGMVVVGLRWYAEVGKLVCEGLFMWAAVDIQTQWPLT
jgi:hypothetical protein